MARKRYAVAAMLGVVGALGAAVGQAPVAGAATGNQGYAVYRDGVPASNANFTWHAAIMDDPHYNSTSLPVIHHPGSGYVKFGSWSEFISGNTYKGTYRPKVAPSSSDRDNFVYKARVLRGESIPYTLTKQLEYGSSVGTYVDPSEITAIRCDGVVEYVFEWYNFKVHGTYIAENYVWDVTKAGYWEKTVHSGLAVTPKSQAQEDLKLVTTSLP